VDLIAACKINAETSSCRINGDKSLTGG